MDNNLEKEDITSICLPSCLSQPVLDVDPDMPTLYLDLNECGNPQNLTSCKRKFKMNVTTDIWSLESATFSEEESSNSSPPHLCRFDEDDKEPLPSGLSPKTNTLPDPEVPILEKTDGWKEQTPVPSVNLTDVLLSRRSAGITFQLRKSSWRKNRPDGCCTFDGEIPYPTKRQIRKRKSKKSSFRGENFVNDCRITELTALTCHVDEIDGFTISSFATLEDLDRFYAEQLPMHANTKTTPNSRVEGEERLPSDHSTVVPAEVRCSGKTKMQLDKLNLRKRRPHRYSTLASSSSPFQESVCSKTVVSDIPGECDNLCQIDGIDGFRISSFTTLEDLGKVCEHQFLIEAQLKTIRSEAETTSYEICSAESCPAVPESFPCSVPDECRSMICQFLWAHQELISGERLTANLNVEVQRKPSSNRQKPVYNLKHFPANRKYTEKKYIFIRLKRKMKDLKNQLAKAYKEGEA